ncbi:O-antigen ligase [Acinetobacter sp. Marseille-Q1618]|uniref:O-antigen ligase family protein n=1 Tax=Acinetobacter sp. Marseille-Q1618 TaxID=2697502 RepID=UPI00156F9CB8|nr:O-antigen ligase family protein [Acinetobacter sp. Marseille-Q1618]
MLRLLKNYLFLFLLGLSYFFGIISFQHYSPSVHDFYINTICYSIVALGIFIFLFKNKSSFKLYSNNIFWLVVLSVFIIQSLVNDIIYVDGLVFPVSIVFLLFILSICISNYKDKNNINYIMAVFFIFSSVMLLITQFIHVFKIMPLVDFFRLPLQTKRYSGNIFQPNQAAFIFSLGAVSSMLLFENNRKIINYFLLFILGIGVAFTASRSGLLIIISAVLVFNLYKNFKLGKHFLKLYEFYVVLLSLIVGISIYSNFAIESVIDRAGKSLSDPRWSLLKQSWLDFSNHPLTGVGWKNFASSNFDYYTKLDWISLTDHSHFIFGHILAEFGLLGLIIIIYFFYILINNLKNISDVKGFYVFIVLMVFILYSCFEYPLWYFRYLFVFAIFLSLFDGKLFSYQIDKSYLLYVPVLILMVISIYYINQYRKLTYINDIVFNQDQSSKNKMQAMTSMEPTFGFSYFQDLLFYEAIEDDSFLLKDKIIIGERLVNYVPDFRYLVKQGKYLALDNQKEKSLLYFSLACKYDSMQKCPYVISYLVHLNYENPRSFGEILDKVKFQYTSYNTEKN